MTNQNKVKMNTKINNAYEKIHNLKLIKIYISIMSDVDIEYEKMSKKFIKKSQKFNKNLPKMILKALQTNNQELLDKIIAVKKFEKKIMTDQEKIKKLKKNKNLKMIKINLYIKKKIFMSRYRKTFKKKIIQKTNRSYEGIEDSKIRLPKLLAHSKKLNDIESYIKISQRIQKNYAARKSDSIGR